jgi:hypothetical protein
MAMCLQMNEKKTTITETRINISSINGQRQCNMKNVKDRFKKCIDYLLLVTTSLTTQ